jgi:hypothetical protein
MKDKYVPHTQEKDRCWWIRLKVMQRFGAILHRHIARERSELESVLRKLLLKPLQSRSKLREYQTLGCDVE